MGTILVIGLFVGLIVITAMYWKDCEVTEKEYKEEYCDGIDFTYKKSELDSEK